MVQCTEETLSITSLRGTVRSFSHTKRPTQERSREESLMESDRWNSTTDSPMRASLKMESNQELGVSTFKMETTVSKAPLRTISLPLKPIKCFLSLSHPLLKRKSLTLKPKRTQKPWKRMPHLLRKKRPSMEARRSSWNASQTSSPRKLNSIWKSCTKAQITRTLTHPKKMKRLRKSQLKVQPFPRSLR